MRPDLGVNPRPRRLSTPSDAFQLHPDIRSYGPSTLSVSTEEAWKIARAYSYDGDATSFDRDLLEREEKKEKINFWRSMIAADDEDGVLFGGSLGSRW